MEDEEFYVPLAKRGSRFENSLGLLTRRFRGLVDRSDTAVVDLNEAADVLGVRKRRIYDITNVLEGVGMIKKTSKNTVTFQRGCLKSETGIGTSELKAIRVRVDEMHSTEAAMDAYIAAAAAQLRDMVDRGAQDGLAFLLQDEVRGIPSLAGHTVLALKAPPGTTLEVPDPDEGATHGSRRYQMLLQSSLGSIDLFVVNDPIGNGSGATLVDVAPPTSPPPQTTSSLGATGPSSASIGDEGTHDDAPSKTVVDEGLGVSPSKPRRARRPMGRHRFPAGVVADFDYVELEVPDHVSKPVPVQRPPVVPATQLYAHCSSGALVSKPIKFEVPYPPDGDVGAMSRSAPLPVPPPIETAAPSLEEVFDETAEFLGDLFAGLNGPEFDVAAFQRKMCLLVFGKGAHPAFPFVLAHNRDELFDRATADPVEFPTDNIISGVDGVHGGTWLGFNRKTGMLAAMTNVRHVLCPDVPKSVGTSRGVLLRQWLLKISEEAVPPRPTPVTPLGGQFSGFNLLLGNLFRMHTGDEADNMTLVSNAPQPYFGSHFKRFSPDSGRVYQVSQGVHAISNSFFNDFTWPKVRHVSREMTTILTGFDASSLEADEVGTVRQLASQLLRMMTNDFDFSKHDKIPDVSFSTDPPAVECHNQRIFQAADASSSLFEVNFGTRAQTLVIRTKRNVHFLYRNTDKWPIPAPLFHAVVPVPDAAFSCSSPTSLRTRRVALTAITLAVMTLGLLFGGKSK